MLFEKKHAEASRSRSGCRSSGISQTNQIKNVKCENLLHQTHLTDLFFQNTFFSFYPGAETALGFSVLQGETKPVRCPQKDR